MDHYRDGFRVLHIEFSNNGKNPMSLGLNLINSIKKWVGIRVYITHTKPDLITSLSSSCPHPSNLNLSHYQGF